MGVTLGITMAIKRLVVLVCMLPQSLLSIRAWLGIAFSVLAVCRKTLGLGPEVENRLLEMTIPKQRARF